MARLTQKEVNQAWEGDMHKAGIQGKVVNVYPKFYSYGGLALIVELADGRKYSPYFNQSPYDECTGIKSCQCDGHQAERSPRWWARSLYGATEWDNPELWQEAS